MEETIQKEVEELILEEEISKLQKGINVTEFKIEKNPPVIKPTKKVDKEIGIKKSNVTEFKIEKNPSVTKPTKELTEKEIEEVIIKK